MTLMESLSDSFDPDPVKQSPEWIAELEGRIAQIESGEVEPVSWEEVQARVR